MSSVGAIRNLVLVAIVGIVVQWAASDDQDVNALWAALPLLSVGIILQWAMQNFSPIIYDVVIVNMTSVWYQSVLTRVAATKSDNKDSPIVILDVGIGTGTALLKNRNFVKSNPFHILGIDYDGTYVVAAQKAVAQEQLEKQIQVKQLSVYEHDSIKDWIKSELAANGNSSADLDAIYFSGSWSVLPDPVEALISVSGLLPPGGRIYITQTFSQTHNSFMARFKPLIKYLTTIDFGQLITKKDALNMIEASGLKLLEQTEIVEKDSARHKFSAPAYLTVLQVPEIEK